MAVLDICRAQFEKISPQSMGDGGVDLVGVVNFMDKARTSYVMFGQCAAQEKNWPTKRFEGRPESLRGYFHMLHEGPFALFISVCYRDSSGEWLDFANLGGVLLLDRERIIYLIEQQDKAQEITEQAWFVEFEESFRQVAAEAA